MIQNLGAFVGKYYTSDLIKTAGTTAWCEDDSHILTISHS